MSEAKRSIIITGAGSGIGKSCAETFIRNGYRVGLVGRRIAPLKDVADGHADALPLPGDVTDPQQVEDIFQRAFDKWGRIDVLFNNAGIAKPGRPIDEIPVEDWLETVDVNLTGAFLCARQAFRIMRQQSPQGGRIINNGSVSAYVPRPGSVPYTATKHAITGLTRTLSLDGRPFNIACGQIDIGNALTEMAQPMTKGVPQADGSVRPEATMDVDNVASSVLHMAELPLDANVQFMTVMATAMPYVGRG
ncbi:SDR family oxidoreductase [Nitratireductor sp. XY-223]|uniref:SDR family oxidoreductase n=1 Tax=Nitratireductor sp. XY-223 TaxID=2561926 RepID=UPI0010AA25D5|nr:SDR family oxidoreductase [Nitratireductor sp. XY-223]